jgi:FemAB-related protein (PEP-CTERM system-associated)
MAIICKPLDDAHASAWDEFVHSRPDGSFFHRAGWSRIIRDGLGHTPSYVMALQDGVITGVLPMARVRTRLFGDQLISVPFCVYGGPLAVDAQSSAALQDHAAQLMDSAGIPVAEWRFRSAPPEDFLDPAQWISRSDLYVTFRKSFTADDDANLKAIPRKQRAVVRKGIDGGLVSVVETNPDRLHGIYAESVRNLGTPVFSRRYFRVLMQEFGRDADVVTVLDGQTALSSVMNFYFRDEVLPYYGGGTTLARSRHGNDFMYWEVMRRAAARGFSTFDFGRSKLGTGALAFKKNWGFNAEKLHYRFRLAEGASIPDLNPLNPKYRMFIAAWKRLPLPVANLVGPHIVRGLG